MYVFVKSMGIVEVCYCYFCGFVVNLDRKVLNFVFIFIGDSR